MTTAASLEPQRRRELAGQAVTLFNRRQYWEAHEALEGIWRAVDDEVEARVLQGLIQAAAALLHQARGNPHGVRVVGKAALDKLSGPQLPVIEFETVQFRAALEAALAGAPPPTLELRTT
ncbi:MAG: DUF309 domain-containing protein [Gemmatimonadetes bacterium]|nr:DUF309 domain-containing protein [Gemmatimonadota bacterium]